MAFYVEHSTLHALTCRSKQVWCDYRRDGVVKFEKSPKGKFISDVDDPKIRSLIQNPPSTATNIAKQRQKQAMEDFIASRADGSLVCARTGEVDHMAAIEGVDMADLLPNLDDSLLDRKKKEGDVLYREKQIEKLDRGLKILDGDLIDRTFVESWIIRYVGNMHQQILDQAGTGLGTDLYNIVMRHGEEDSGAAIKEVEKHLERELSQIIKDSMDAMRRNSL